MTKRLLWIGFVCLGTMTTIGCSEGPLEEDADETRDDSAGGSGGTSSEGGRGGQAAGGGGGNAPLEPEEPSPDDRDAAIGMGPDGGRDGRPLQQDAGNTPTPLDAASVERKPPPGMCTQIIGMSITGQWSLSTGTFERLVDGEAWQMQIRPGRGVGAWADPNFDGWAVPVQSPCTRLSQKPDRVLFEVLSASGFRGETDAGVIEREIHAMLATLRNKMPSVRAIILQPVVGGPGGRPCPRGDSAVMASLVHPAAATAIDRVVASDKTGTLYASFAPTVRTCADYTVENGNPGHLDPAARPAIAERMAAELRDL